MVWAAAADRYDAVLFDLDGVLYRGDRSIPGAPDTLRALREKGREVVFLTNNSARTPEEVAEKLEGMGIPADPSRVVTSAMATASMLDGLRSAFVIGEEGLRAALTDAGVEVLGGETERADAVVIGWDRSVDYEALRTASVLIQRGARLFATNTDASYPAPGGELWPGAGALVAAVEATTGVRAEVGGKPHSPLFEAALDRAGARPERTLMVGDRVETDLVGADRAGIDGAAVFSGASGPADLLEHDAPAVVAMDDVAGLLEPRPIVRVGPAGDRADEARALAEEAGLPAEGGAEEALAATADGEIVGTASVAVRGDVACLHSVAVRPDARGLHVGTLIVAAAVRRAVSAGARACLLVTEDAAGFFGRLGFEETDRDGLPDWVAERSRACSVSATAMRRRISPST
ncbi:MAG TPA: HAD-IIA family hydrolase [Actinomycetota bacterium]|nr:HAD-IIA family hydrolase [Actinomycetota bacterium]